ncbi:MAG: hypothetical protein ACTSRC_04445 [Candidatus Helarchaeota archaeon]
MATTSNSDEKLFAYPPTTSEQRLIWEILFLLPFIIAIAIFGYRSQINMLYTWIISIIFLINLCFRFALVNERGDWLFFLLGVALGGGNDLFSMLNGVYHYTSITILPYLNGLLPLFQILFWGQVFLLFRKIYHIHIFKGDAFKKTGPLLQGWIDYRLIADIILFIVLRIIIYNTFLLDAWIPTVLYALAIIIRLAIFRPRCNELFIIAILPYAYLFEGLMVSFGLYVYINPVFLGLSGWLLIWWLFLVPFLLKEIFDRLDYLLIRNS